MTPVIIGDATLYHGDCLEILNDEQMAVMGWLANGRYVGISSKTMAFWITFKRKIAWASHPHDPDDLDRCLRLLALIPTLRERLPLMMELSTEWAALVSNWDEIERSHLDEVGLGWTKARSAPLTYKLMKRVIDNARTNVELAT